MSNKLYLHGFWTIDVDIATSWLPSGIAVLISSSVNSQNLKNGAKMINTRSTFHEVNRLEMWNINMNSMKSWAVSQKQ